MCGAEDPFSSLHLGTIQHRHQTLMSVDLAWSTAVGMAKKHKT